MGSEGPGAGYARHMSGTGVSICSPARNQTSCAAHQRRMPDRVHSSRSKYSALSRQRGTRPVFRSYATTIAWSVRRSRSWGAPSPGSSIPYTSSYSTIGVLAFLVINAFSVQIIALLRPKCNPTFDAIQRESGMPWTEFSWMRFCAIIVFALPHR